MNRILALALMLLPVLCACDRRALRVSFYPTYGYLNEARNEWTIPVRAWVRSPHEKTHGTLTAAAWISSEERKHKLFGGRIADIATKSEEDQDVRFTFDKDPREEVFRIAADDGKWPLSNEHGVVEGTFKLPQARAAELLRAQGSTGWLTLHEISPGRDSSGRVLLIPPEGQSVVSDIDDTVKVTDILAGKETVLRNTFLREFVAAPGMAAWYRSLADQDHVFHFVSAGPWQLHGPVSTFLSEAGYPEAIFHMRAVYKDLTELSTWESLHALTPPDATKDFKVGEISKLMRRFPRRTFTLIGDSGEQDPEAFSTVREQFGSQVTEIYIRHVRPEAQDERLAGMKIIDPETGAVRPAG